MVLRKTRGGSVASDHVTDQVGCDAFNSMNQNFTVNVFRGGALIKSEEISYKIFNEQLGGDCTACLNQESSTLSIGKSAFSPPIESVRGTEVGSALSSVPGSFTATLSQPLGQSTSYVNNAVYPEIYSHFSRPLSLYGMFGGVKNIVIPPQASPKPKGQKTKKK